LGWLCYHFLCQSKLSKNNLSLTLCVLILIVFVSWFYSSIFANRGALLHTGVFIGTLMAFNVFGVIIPNQKKIVRALVESKRPDLRLAQSSKTRSMHNTWLTLPVILMMVSGHYPFLSATSYLWLVVLFILIAGACLRYALVSHEVGRGVRDYFWAALGVFIAILAAFVITIPNVINSSQVSVISTQQAVGLVEKHCTTCHSNKPSHPDFEEPPFSIVLENINDITDYRDQILQASVYSEYMPLGNETDMTVEERAQLGAYLEAR
ncbi:MAG: urate hydroxylase PuuD, partial [Pseudomonadota bacterium]